MSNSTSISAETQPTDVVSFKLLSNNTALSGEYRVVALEISRSFNKIALGKITLADGDPAKQDFPISSKDDSLIPGNDFEIQMGYHGKPKSVFKGVITKQSIRSVKNKTSA